MKRPIPEGVTKPHPNAIILGYGGTFKVPDSGFDGWYLGHFVGEWSKSWTMGVVTDILYAADAGSEVARLNQTSEGIPADRDRNSDIEEGPTTTNPPQIITSLVDERDGAIRGITTDLERSLLALLFDPKYSDMSLDQIRTLASGYVTQGNNTDQTEDDIREFIAYALKTPRLERR